MRKTRAMTTLKSTVRQFWISSSGGDKPKSVLNSLDRRVTRSSHDRVHQVQGSHDHSLRYRQIAEGSARLRPLFSTYLDSSLCSHRAAVGRDWHPSCAIPSWSPRRFLSGLPEENERRNWKDEGALKDSGELKAEFEAALRAFSHIPAAVYSLPKMNPNGFLSANEEREQLFISDTNRHRVIVVDASGKILDCIGSFPGFEDGTFERARLCQPSSTVFDQHHDCLYIADSKNHVIRRANMSNRSVDTLGLRVEHDGSPVYSRFAKWLQGVTQGTGKEQQRTVSTESDSVLKDPCHLKLASDGSLLVASHEFESLWMLCPNSGHCSRLSYEGSAAVYEEFKKRSGAPDPPSDTFSPIHPTPDRHEIVSRVAKIRDSLFYLDAEDHIVRKVDLQTGRSSTLELSYFGRLGLPAWWSIHPLGLLGVDSKDCGLAADSTQEEEMASTEIRIRPGRCLLCIEPLLPEGMTLAAPVEDGSVWRQARGSIVELSTFGGRLRAHKVSGAQQWVDDFEDSETDSEIFEELVGPQQSEYGLPLYSSFDASLGSGEVLVDAVLYVKPAISGSSEVSSVVNSNAAEKPSGEKDVMGGQEDRLRLRKLHVRVRIEVTETAGDERTHIISVRV